MTASTARIRVMQVIGSLHIGGAENVVANLARELDPSRFDVAVRCTREFGVIAERLQREGVDVRLTAARRRQFRHLTPLLIAREARRWRADIVHTHGLVAMLHTAPAAMLGLMPAWIHTFHFGNYDAPITGWMRAEGWMVRKATGLVAVANAQKRSIVQRYLIPESRIHTIVNGVAGAAAADDPAARARKRAEFGLAPDDLVVGCVAVLSRQKGITHLLQAVPAIIRRHPRVRVLIVGGGFLEADLRREAAALGLGDRIVFTGWRPDGVQILPVFDVFVMSSLWEAMPMVLLESMAAALPIVVTDVGENRDIVDDGRCGVVIPPANADAIARGVGQLLADPGAAREMGLRARARFESHFTIRRMAAEYEALFASVVPGNPRAGSVLVDSRQNV